MKDPFHDHDTFLPNYSTSGDKEPSVSDGYMKRPEAEIKTLQAEFLKFNVKFWIGIFKYHPLFFHHRCDGWAWSNNSKIISMCPMSSSNCLWQHNNDLAFIDSTHNIKAPSIEEFRPVVCHCKKQDVVITCS